VTYSVTLEHGADGTYLAWVHELPGCYVRGGTREEVEAELPSAIGEFLTWFEPGGAVPQEDIDVVTVAEVESPIQASDDTEVLLEPDRSPLRRDEWEKIERWLRRSRRDLLDLLDRLLDADLERRPEGRSRTLRQELIHIGLVELMYAAWTFDLRSREGLRAFLDWTRDVSIERMRPLADSDEGSITYAEWAGATRSEEWTARKAARRLIWHELVHFRFIAGAIADGEGWATETSA
jgi:predicted RNase H-like HicB family nuclease